MSTRSGALNRRIDIYAVSTTQDSRGGAEESLTLVHQSIAAQVRELRASEMMSQGGETAQITRAFIIRYRSGITTNHVIKYQNQEYDIESINELGLKDRLELGATARGIE